ncbi:AGAP007680-PA-like protein [Anopheles sinensis]|uniref:AGAP007680-PA-like protein n=1 Tax=Anopheles sinensis TaxID=74873 RepID=A0A084VF24_ANOSI|nr:AGAP007680-PA-like protein [Anopheles sinensis]
MNHDNLVPSGQMPPDAMTVSVSQPQQPIESVHCSSSSPTPGTRILPPPRSALLDAAVASPSMAMTTTAPMSSPPPSSSSSTPVVTAHHGPSAREAAEANPAPTQGTPTSALRRLYFKTARASKAAKSAAAVMGVAAAAAGSAAVPKVVVMGSSTTSEATINTSTDSASTHLTNVTTTTDTETNDSLDLGDASGQSELLLSSLEDESSSIIALSQTDGNENEENVTLVNGPDTPLLISYQVCSQFIY